MATTTASATRKDERLEARVSAEAKALCQEAASLEGRSLTDFIVSSAVESARRILRERALIELSERDRNAFVESLLNPPLPGKRLRQAARRYERVLGKR
ncbi:MAG TPA: DUF1778 domain-containing protein [Terriglobia bacterium]|nr:DUF1778 domain-containing protein [Terriglobia bacterium]